MKKKNIVLLVSFLTALTSLVVNNSLCKEVNG